MDAIANKDIIINCGGEFLHPEMATGTDVGYVFPTNPYEIFLSARFWDPGVGHAGAIVHEMSHFYVVAGTLDIAGGSEAPCRKLATENPSEAIKNADSYHYFAESFADRTYTTTPSLVDFASNRCENKPFSVKANLMLKLRIPEMPNTSLRSDIMSK